MPLTLPSRCFLYAKDAIDMMLIKCKNEVQADLVRHKSLDYIPFDPAVKTNEPYVKENSSPDVPFKVKKGAPYIDHPGGLCPDVRY